MTPEAFSHGKRFVRVGDARVAYYEEGRGEPVLLLHGCPFSSFVWRKVIPRLSPRYRCLAPDLLGLGDTETPNDADWSLRAQAAMVVGFLAALDVQRAHVIGHDHGGALAQLLAAERPERVDPLRRDIPGAVRVLLLPQTGHLLMEERPEQFATFVDAFLSERIAGGG
jgi:pimeloyl-ACP methyl ester carboxylesterase